MIWILFLDGKKYHELYYLYNVELDDECNLYDGMPNYDNDGSRYFLLSDDEFKKDRILPEVLKDIITNDTFKNYIVNDLK